MKALVVLMMWTKMKQAEVASFVLNVVAKMTGNDSFATPAVKLDDLSKAAQLYEQTFGNRVNGKNARAEFKTAKTNLFAMLKDQALYINSIAAKSTEINVQDEIITSAGMVSSKNGRSKKTTPAQPKAPTVAVRNGDVNVSVPAVKSAATYLWVIFFDKPFDIAITNQQLIINQMAKYIMIPAGKSRENLSGIAVGTDIYVQALAQNSAGKSAFTPAIPFHVGG